jgi:hypothetical protein
MTKITGIIMSENKLTGSLGVRNEINVDIIGTGARGKEGKSAYEIWLDLGNEGTEQEFLASLKGDKGDKGDTGETGEPGSSFLPVASGDVIGGIMVGENLKIVGGVLSVDTTALRAYVDESILGGAS